MKTTLSIIALFLAHTTLAGDDGFICYEYDPETGVRVDDGAHLEADTDSTLGSAIVGKVRLRDPGHTDILLSVTQYWNGPTEIKFLSVENLERSETPGDIVQRRVELQVTAPEVSDILVGLLSESYSDDDQSYTTTVECLRSAPAPEPDSVER